MKIKYIIFTFLSFLVFECNVFATEMKFENSNGIILNEQEYNYILKMFNKDFFDTMTVDDYNNLLMNTNIDDNVIEIFNTGDLINPLATELTNDSRTLKIGKSCSNSYCTITINVVWNSIPNVKSYDVIGSRFDGNIDYVTYPKTKVITNVNSYFLSDSPNYLENGYGASVKIPDSVNSITLSQYFKVSGSGTIYSSYQHAIKSISLTNSKKYTLSSSGYGKVFKFNKEVESYYDKTEGVNITI